MRAHPLPFVAVATLLLLTLAIAGLASGQADVSFAAQGAGEVGLLAPPPAPKTITFYATADTYVDNCTPDSNFSAADVLYVANDTTEFVCDRWLLTDFNLASYPAGVIFRSASLHLYQHSEYSGDGTKTMGIYAASSAWNGGSVTWNTRPGVFAFLDYGSVGTGAGWRAYDVTDVVQRWLEVGVAEHGFVIKPNTSGSWMRSFRSMNYGSGATYKPYLIVTYDLPTATPTATAPPTKTPTATATRTAPPKVTSTATPTATRTATPKITHTATPTATATRSATASPTGTPTRTATTPPTKTPTVTATRTATPKVTSTATPTATKMIAVTATPTPTRTPTATAGVCADDPYEPNSRFEDAALITSGATVRAYICPDTDFDLFRFTVVGLSQVRVTLSELPQDYQLALFGPDHTVVARAGGADRRSRTIDYAAVTTGDYWARVSPGSVGHPTSPYALTVEVTPLTSMSLFAMADTYVMAGDPTSTHGDERTVIVGRDEFNQEQRGLFRFDLARVPAVTIADATFMVSLGDAVSGIHTLDLRRVSAAWDEDTVNWNTKPWSVDTGISAAVGGVAGRYYTWDVTALVQSWLTGGVGNLGLELRGQVGVFSRVFRSSEYAAGMLAAPGSGSARTPRLIINFTRPDPGLLGSIGGRVYEDANSNGRFDAGEPGLSGVAVELFRERVSQGDQATDVNGVYAFTGLPAGAYEVSVRASSLPGTHRLTGDEIHAVALAAGENRTGVDYPTTRRPTPTPLPPITLDLFPQEVEFVQVVQGAPLIDHKSTLVRVYVGVTGSDEVVRNVSATLYRSGHLFDGIAPIAPANLLPTADPFHDPAIMANFDRTINFILPDDWTPTGRPNFHIVVNPVGPYGWPECRPDCSNNNQATVGAQFHDTDPLSIRMLAITSAGHRPEVGREETVRWLRKTYPLNDVNIYTGAMVSLSNFSDTRGPSCGNPWNWVLLELGWKWFWSGEWGRIYYGMVPEAVVPIPGTVGCGYTPGHKAAGWVTAGRDDGARTMAHEIGHNLGREHTYTPGGGEAGCGWYPHTDGLLGTAYGVDFENLTAPVYVNPAATYDIMGYSDPQWMSDYTFGQLFNEVSATTLAERLMRAQAADQGEQEYLVAAGFIADQSLTALTPFYRVLLPVGSGDEPDSGLYSLTLEDAHGAALFTRHFDVHSPVTDAPNIGDFMEIVPWQPGTARVVISQGQTVIHTQAVSAHAPTVTLLSPNGGEQWAPYSDQTITWSANDADGDALHYVVQYSPDNGASWQALATDLTETSYTLNAAQIPGGEKALVRVLATDGVNTAQDDSDAAFTVEGKPPAAMIFDPVAGHIFLPGAPLVLDGAGADLEDGPITDDSRFRWRSDLEGELGVGQRLFFEDLLPGWHTITLAVTDSDHFVGETSVTVFVGRQTYLPVMLK